MKLLRLLLYPFSIIYGGILAIRHFLYDSNILKYTRVTEPGICVGNLALGGTGKTPLVTYLLELLSSNNKVALVSRGYKRDSRGFILADDKSSLRTLGDESFLQHSKFPQILIAVDANRSRAYKNLRTEYKPDIFLFDDAFQHRKIKVGLNIILSTYSNFLLDDHLIPTGNLRDLKSRKKEAQIIIISKCPKSIKDSEKQNIGIKLNLSTDQQLYFTGIRYGLCHNPISEEKISPKNIHIFLITAIADPQPVIDHLQNENNTVKHFKFSDHYDFKRKDWDEFCDIFDSFESSEKIALCTEKDYVKLNVFLRSPQNKTSLFVLPMEIDWFKEKEIFDQSIRNYVRENK